MDVCCIIFSLLAQECEAPPSVQTFYELPSPRSAQHAGFTVLRGKNALFAEQLRIHSRRFLLTFYAAIGSRSQSPARAAMMASADIRSEQKKTQKDRVK